VLASAENRPAIGRQIIGRASAQLLTDMVRRLKQMPDAGRIAIKSELLCSGPHKDVVVRASASRHVRSPEGGAALIMAHQIDVLGVPQLADTGRFEADHGAGHGQRTANTTGTFSGQPDRSRAGARGRS
jgi:hypothetical protein